MLLPKDYTIKQRSPPASNEEEKAPSNSGGTVLGKRPATTMISSLEMSQGHHPSPHGLTAVGGNPDGVHLITPPGNTGLSTTPVIQEPPQPPVVVDSPPSISSEQQQGTAITLTDSLVEVPLTIINTTTDQQADPTHD